MLYYKLTDKRKASLLTDSGITNFLLDIEILHFLLLNVKMKHDSRSHFGVDDIL